MNFYGYEAAPDNVRETYNTLLRCWSAETCAPRMRGDWSEENPTLGQCSITSFLVQDFMGGEVRGILLPDGAYHCFNIVDGFAFDLTSGQFAGERLDYSSAVPQLREEHFSNEDKYRRYLLLKKRFFSCANHACFIRKARPDDAVRLAETEVFCYRAFFFPIFRTEKYFFSELSTQALIEEYRREPERIESTLVYDDGIIKGFVRARNSEIEKLFVEPAFQNKGIGGALFGYAAEKLGGKRLLVLEKNEGAIRLYKRLGFHETGEKQRVDDTSEFFSIMRKG